MRNTIVVISLLLMIITLFPGCQQHATSPEDERYSYPLTIGNRWEFERDYVFYEYQDSISVSPPVDSMVGHDSSSVFVLQEITLFDTLETIQLIQQTWLDTGVTGEPHPQLITGTYYYQENETGLFLVGYDAGYMMIMPKQTATQHPVIIGPPIGPPSGKLLPANYFTRVSKTAENDVYFEDPPVHVLQYPIEPGAHWNYREPHEPFHMARTVRGDTTITVPGGTFSCTAIDWHWDRDHDGEWDRTLTGTDYLAPEGIVKRVILWHSAPVAGEDRQRYLSGRDVYQCTRLEVQTD